MDPDVVRSLIEETDHEPSRAVLERILRSRLTLERYLQVARNRA